MYFTFDIETYPNFFSCVVKCHDTGQIWTFEVSDWVNNARDFIAFMYWLGVNDKRLVGFNNFYFDWQVVEHLLSIGPTFTARDAYDAADRRINGTKDEKFKSTVWGSKHLVKQVDLYLIHHFDNFAKSTSLKEVEFNNRAPNVGDLPFPPGTVLTYEQGREVLRYNGEDVSETEKFFDHSEPMVTFRESLIPSMGYDVMNYNDTKIGKKFFEQELKRTAPHLLGTGGNKRQTHRTSINFSNVIMPSIEFETPELSSVLRFLKNTTITRTKSPPELKGLHANLNGFVIHLGAGGGHASIERRHVKPRDGWKIVDVDVASYYPNIAIANRFYPAHLSEAFCDIYNDVYELRKATPKKTAPNEMYKLALNGVYGDSGNEHSIFYDTQYTMQITINGQLLLCKLAELIVTRTSAEMIQLNTDGITFQIRERDEKLMRELCEWWENWTKLTLEYAEYSDMWIRDVNNYVARTTDGHLKRIGGVYGYETQRENPATREVKWGKDHSALVVQKASVAAMVNGVSCRDFIMNHADGYDFLLRSKATGKTRQRLFPAGSVDTPPLPEMALLNGQWVHKHHINSKGDAVYHNVFEPDGGQWLQKMTRYYIAKNGAPLQMVHHAAPASKERRKQRIIGKHVGWDVAICDNIDDFDPANLNVEWYIEKAEANVIT